MSQFSGANESSDFDGNTLLLESENNEDVYISGLEIFKFKTDDKYIEYISLIGNNMVPCTIIIGEKYTYFIDYHYKFIENDKIAEGTLLNATNNSLDPYVYHLVKCGKDSFKNLERSLIHTFWPGVGEDIENEDDDLIEEDVLVEEDGELIEIAYLNGNNEVVKIFNQSVLYVMKKIVFMLLGSVVINVFLKNVIKIKVILIY